MILTAEIWAFAGLCRRVASGVPIESNWLPEQKDLLTMFRQEVAKFTDDFQLASVVHKKEVCDKIEEILRKEYTDPLTMIEVREILERVRALPLEKL